MTPILLATIASLVGALPPTVDHWIAQKIKGAALLALATSAFGVLDGSVAALFTQVAQGSTWGDAETLVGIGLVSGLGTALVNFLKSGASGTSSGGGAGLIATSGASRIAGAAIGFAIVVLAVCASGCAAFEASKLPSDLEAEGLCIEQDVIKGTYSPVQIAKDCDLAEEQIAYDGIALLLDSAEFTAAHPAAVTALKPVVAAHRAAATQ